METYALSRSGHIKRGISNFGLFPYGGISLLGFKRPFVDTKFSVRL